MKSPKDSLSNFKQFGNVDISSSGRDQTYFLGLQRIKSIDFNGTELICGGSKDLFHPAYELLRCRLRDDDVDPAVGVAPQDVVEVLVGVVERIRPVTPY